MTLILALALLRQDESLDSLVRKLGSESVLERDKAAADLKCRAASAMEAIQKAEKRAVDPAEKARLRRALEEILGYKPLTIDRVREAKVTCALGPLKARAAASELGRLAGLPVEVEGPADVDPAVSGLAGKELSLETLLDSLARQAGGVWLVDSRRILLFLPGKVPIRLYDVRDLTSGVEDEPMIALEPDGSDRPEGERGGLESSRTFTGEDLANLIRFDLSPKSWEEADGKSLQFQNGVIIARNDAEILESVEGWLQRLRRQSLTEVRIELEAYAVKAGRKVEEGAIERLREEAAEGKTARRLAAFDRTERDKRQITLGALSRSILLTGYAAEGVPVTSLFTTGTKANLRASLDGDRTNVRVDLEAGWSRLLSVEKRREEAGEVQVPTFASHVLKLSLGVPAGRSVLLGRIGETKIADGLADIVLVGRFTVVGRP